MEVKKNPKADLTRKTGFFFSIALLVTMSVVLTAFEWKHYEARIAEITQRNADKFEDFDVPVTNIEPPLPSVAPAPVIVAVPDEEEMEEIRITIDVSTTTQSSVEPIAFTPTAIEPEESEEIILFPESSASFDGGIEAFYRYVSDKIKYPAQARRMGIQGKVFVEFVINRDGSITEVKAVKGIGGGCDEEATRVVQGSPKWNAGKQRGKPVRQRMVLPIVFQIN